MDRSLYVAMTGASRSFQTQTAISHNIANASTVGFKALLTNAEAKPIKGQGFDSRVNTLAQAEGFDSTPGALEHTGRQLDIALREDRWLVVQAADGTEAYTRAGDLQLTDLGQLTTHAGQMVIGDGGPVAVPPARSITIGSDGTVSIVPQGQGPETLLNVGRLRVVEATPDQLERGADGLFRARADQGQPADAAGNVLASGVLEASNVNLAENMVRMIEEHRRFELQIKAMKTADDNAEQTSRLLRTA